MRGKRDVRTCARPDTLHCQSVPGLPPSIRRGVRSYRECVPHEGTPYARYLVTENPVRNSSREDLRSTAMAVLRGSGIAPDHGNIVVAVHRQILR